MAFAMRLTARPGPFKCLNYSQLHLPCLWQDLWTLNHPFRAGEVLIYKNAQHYVVLGIGVVFWGFFFCWGISVLYHPIFFVLFVLLIKISGVIKIYVKIKRPLKIYLQSLVVVGQEKPPENHSTSYRIKFAGCPIYIVYTLYSIL